MRFDKAKAKKGAYIVAIFVGIAVLRMGVPMGGAAGWIAWILTFLIPVGIAYALTGLVFGLFSREPDGE